MAHYSNPQKLKLVYVNHYYICGCEVRRIAEDAAQPDQLEDFLWAPLGDTLWLMSDQWAQLRWKRQLGLIPTHPVNISCGRKQKYPERINDFR
jgi:hypothetical protein